MTDLVEVIRPSRQQRRRRGKFDPIDAHAAAAVALADDEMPVPKSRDGQIEQIPALLVARRSAAPTTRRLDLPDRTRRTPHRHLADRYGGWLTAA